MSGLMIEPADGLGPREENRAIDGAGAKVRIDPVSRIVAVAPAVVA